MLLCCLIATLGSVFGFNVGLLVAVVIGARRRRSLVEEVGRLRAERRAPVRRFARVASPRMRALFG